MLFAQAGAVRADLALAPLQGNVYSQTFGAAVRRFLIPDEMYGTRYFTITVYSSDAYVLFGRADVTPSGTLSSTQPGPNPGTNRLLVHSRTGWLLRKEVDYNFVLPASRRFRLGSVENQLISYFGIIAHQREPGGPTDGVWELRMTHIEQ